MSTQLPIIYPDSEPCSCPICVDMCRHRSCWPTPDEAKALIASGFGNRLMPDYWVGNRFDDEDANIMILAPADEFYVRNGRTSSWPDSPCSFLKNGKCELHALGLKPYEGRAAHHGMGENDLHWSAASAWNNAEAQAMVEEWEG